MKRQDIRIHACSQMTAGIILLLLLSSCGEKKAAARELEQELIAAQTTSDESGSLFEEAAHNTDIGDEESSVADDGSEEEQSVDPDSLLVGTDGVDSSIETSSELAGEAAVDEVSIPEQNEGDESKTSPAGVMPERPNQPYYTVQIASTPSKSYADEVAALWLERGHAPFVQEFDRDGMPFYRVRLGRFETRSEASDYATSLKDKFDVAGWVDRDQ